MPTRKENSLKFDIPRLAIIAGSGMLPAQLLAACNAQNRDTKIIGIKECTDQVTPDFWSRIGTSGKTIKFLKDEKIKDIVMIGAVKRPGFFDLWPDWMTFKFFFKSWLNSFGDNSLLMAMRGELEKMGFHVHGIHKFLPDLLMSEGVLGDVSLKDKQYLDVQLGLKESQNLGAKDIGQAVIVKDGKVLAREDKHGTSHLIKNHGTDGSILVKTCKPQQDQDLDLPTIGPETAKLCARAKMVGIVGQAGQTLLVEKELVTNIADNHAMFVVGVTIDHEK